jgi:pectate lyase
MAGCTLPTRACPRATAAQFDGTRFVHAWGVSSPRAVFPWLLVSALACAGSPAAGPDDGSDASASVGSAVSSSTDPTSAGSTDVGTTDATVDDGPDPSDDSGSDSTGGDPPAPSSCTEEACAFPGAEGFGTATPGGRGGRVIIVDNLAADGPGSFAEAMLTAEPRIIVFRVSGVIDLGGGTIELGEEHSWVTVAGQSSPGGITITNGTLSSYHADFHDAIFRFLRVRGPTSYDNLSFAGAHDLVIDHCDFSGGNDEAFDITYGHDFTMQWSTVSNSSALEGSQNYGALIAYKPTTNITFHHNFSAHHIGRCGAAFHWAGDEPDPEGGAAIDLRNNVFYNCGFQQIYRADENPASGTRYDLVGNYAVSGPQTPAESMLFGVGGELYMVDNVYEGQDMILTPYFEGTMLDAPHDFPSVTTTSAEEARDAVLAFVGAWPRDAMNTRTVADMENGVGMLGDNSDPLIESGPEPEADADLDGMPDAWEMENDLHPEDPMDASEIGDAGYSQVELYLNDLAQARVGAG